MESPGIEPGSELVSLARPQLSPAFATIIHCLAVVGMKVRPTRRRMARIPVTHYRLAHRGPLGAARAESRLRK